MPGVFKNAIDWLSLVRPMGGAACGREMACSIGDGVMKAAFPLVLTALLGLGSGGAVAQIAPGDPAGNQTIPEKDLSRPAEGGTQNGNATSDENQSLSEKLDKSGGVIKPAEGVDPQIVHPAPVPDPNSMPVIPPAGTPGGPPGPEPK
jgi:NAD(P)H-dependent FMN reductase